MDILRRGWLFCKSSQKIERVHVHVVCVVAIDREVRHCNGQREPWLGFSASRLAIAPRQLQLPGGPFQEE